MKTADRERKCFLCGETIYKGEKYEERQRVEFTNDGLPGTVSMMPVCYGCRDTKHGRLRNE